MRQNFERARLVSRPTRQEPRTFTQGLAMLALRQSEGQIDTEVFGLQQSENLPTESRLGLRRHRRSCQCNTARRTDYAYRHRVPRC